MREYEKNEPEGRAGWAVKSALGSRSRMLQHFGIVETGIATLGLVASYDAALGIHFGISPVSATGTTPPTVTITGTPLGIYSVIIDITLIGVLGVATFKYSLDGGITFSGNIVTAASYSATGSGLTFGFGAGTYALNDIYTAATTVAQWDDQSKTGDSNQNLVQATASKQPTINAVDAAYNNKSTVSFKQALSQTMLSGVWSSSVVGPQTIVLVGNFDGAGNNQYMSDGLAANQCPVFNESGTDQAVLYNGAFLASGLPLSANPVIIIGVYNQLSSALYVSARTVTATGSTGAGATTRTGATLGSAADVVGYLNGKVARLNVYNRVLSQAEIQAEMVELGLIYGIAIGA